MKNQWVPLLVVLDLSATFGTTDHFILLNRLRYDLGINGYISILVRGVSQGSCLGPLLFIIYAGDMFPVIDNPSQGAHGYADDTQLYCSLNPNCAGVRELKIEEMEN